MPGYYSGLLKGMMGVQELKDSETLRQERQQTMQIRAGEMRRQQQERDLMMQAFQGGADVRQGLEDSQDLSAQARKLSAIAARIMPFDPARGTAMMKEAGSMRAQKSLQDVRNIEATVKKNEVLGTTAIGVQDQASLNDAVEELARAGIPVPPKYRTWGPEAQKWWESRARVAKRNLEALKVDASVVRAQATRDAEDRKLEADKRKAAEDDRKAERARIGQEISALRGKASALDPKVAAEFDNILKRLEGGESGAKSNVTQQAYESLKEGDPYYWDGKLHHKGVD